MKSKEIIIGLLGFLLAMGISGAGVAQKKASVFNLGQKGKLQKAENMKTMKLKNGVQALILENHSAPVVALQVWVKAGSADETDSLSGVAHLIEHMMFKGSEKFPSGELSSRIEAKGGQLNAFTTNDFTVYHVTISSRFFETGMELFSDAIFNPKFDQDELEREREVVLEEIRRQEDNPSSRLYNQLIKLAYKSYPYRRPVIGYQETVSGFERGQLMRFFNCEYKPENMIVVLVGDFDAGQATAAVKKYFSIEKPKEQCTEFNQRKIAEPEQKSIQIQLAASPVARAYIYLAYPVPAFGDQDMAALDILATILGQGESSRLVESVRNQKKLVDEIYAYSFTPAGPGMMMIGASLDPKNLIPASSEIISQVQRIKQDGVLDWELDRAKRQIESDAIYSRETVDGNARRVGFFSAIIDDPGYEKKYLDAVEKITTADIKKAAEKYLAVSRLSFAGMMPQKSMAADSESKLKIALLGEVTKPVAATIPVAKPAVNSNRLWPIASPSAGAKMVSEPVEFRLSNGIRVIVRENHYTPLVSVRAGFPGGIRFETEADNGAYNLIAEMFTEGAKGMSASEIHCQTDSLAASIAGFSGRNSFGLTLTVPSPNFEPSMELFAKLLSSPEFPSQDFERIRGLTVASLKREQDQPRKLVSNLFSKTLFSRHPYRFNPLGSEQSLIGLKREDLVNIYQNSAAAQDLVIAVSGDVNADVVKAMLERLFAGFRPGGSSMAAPAPEPSFNQPRTNELSRDGAQSQIMYGWLGTTLSASDQPSVEVMTEILAGMSGRLFVELRDKKSLAYEVSAFHLEGLEPGYIAGYIGCAPEKRQESLDGMIREFNRMKNEPASEDEIQRAKNSLIGGYEIDLQNNMSIATLMFFDELYNLGFGHWKNYAARISTVTWKDIQAAAAKYLTDGYALAVIHPKTEKP